MVTLAGGASPAQAQVSAQAQGSARAFDPIAFFSGRTDGVGKLDEVMASPKKTHVTGTGWVRPNGLFVIDQTVEVEGDTVKHRQWQLRQTTPGHFNGTLSDAKG
ncbi:MAG TPA: hypothetical protein VL100_10020, partial [Croceibacterium sp.]|nr:hypothetical protein [Croceibacterium sp.]